MLKRKKGKTTKKLTAKQKKLDRNKNGRLDKADFKMLRNRRKKKK